MAELARVLPVVEGLGQCRHPGIDRHAKSRGDARRGRRRCRHDQRRERPPFDPEAPAAAAAAAAGGVWVVLMHMRGLPATMNQAPAYRACVLEVHDELAAGLPSPSEPAPPRIGLILDPGLCFAKHEPHNLEILRDLTLLHGLGCR